MQVCVQLLIISFAVCYISTGIVIMHWICLRKMTKHSLTHNAFGYLLQILYLLIANYPLRFLYIKHASLRMLLVRKKQLLVPNHTPFILDERKQMFQAKLVTFRHTQIYILNLKLLTTR